MPAPDEEHQRRPLLALAAKLLVALGFGLALFLLGGQAAHAADGPLDRVTEPLVTTTVRGATDRVVQVSTPRPRVGTVRVLPRHERELATVVVQPRQVEVAAPAIAPPAVPVQVEVPALLSGLPRVEVSTVARHRAPAPRAEAHRAAAPAAEPVVATPARDAAPATAKAADHGAVLRTSDAPRTQPAQAPTSDRQTGEVPAAAASAAGLALAVLGTRARRAPTPRTQLVHTAAGRVPLAPTFEPSFTPD